MSLKDEFKSDMEETNQIGDYDINDKSLLRKVWKRADFPLFFLGAFILVVLLFIVLKMPSEDTPVQPANSLNQQQVKDLKKALDDIRDEIVNIRYSLSQSDSDGINQNVLKVVNQLDRKIDSKFGELKSYMQSRKYKLSAPIVKKKTSVFKKVRKKIDSSSKKGRSFHIVKKGETLYRISKKYNIPVEHIKKLNHMKTNAIQPGEKLIIK